MQGAPSGGIGRHDRVHVRPARHDQVRLRPESDQDGLQRPEPLLLLRTLFLTYDMFSEKIFLFLFPCWKEKKNAATAMIYISHTCCLIRVRVVLAWQAILCELCTCYV